MFNMRTMFMPKTWCALRNCWFMFAKEMEGFQMIKKLMKKHLACLLVTIMCLNTTGIHEVRATESGHTQIQTEQEDESGAETQAEQEDGSGAETRAEQEETAEGTSEIGSEQEAESSERITETETDGDGSGESQTEDETISEEEEGTGSTRTEEQESETETETSESDETYYRYTAENFEVEYRIDAKWDGHYNATVVIHNTGKDVVDNWYLSFQSKDEIQNIYNAIIQEHGEEGYIIKNAQYNQDIEAGNSVSFGFTASYQDRIQIPRAYELLTSMEQADDGDAQVTYEVVNDWGGGFIGKIHIKNNTETVLEDWVLSFDFDNNVESFWTAAIVSKEDGHYVIKNAGYNANIAAGMEIEVGFNCTNGDARKEPQNFRLTSSKMKADKPQKPQKPDREPEPLVDIGEAYFKDIESKKDIAVHSENGMMYVRNQILVSALEGLEKDFFKNVVSDIGAEIVGYIELTNDYQIEFLEEQTEDALGNYIKYLNSLSFIDSAGLNIVIEQEPTITTTNDAVYQEEGKTPEEIWDESIPDGYNWGLKALKVPSAWDYVGESNAVRIGIIDSGFDTNHEDLYFEHIFGNNDPDCMEHGTQVAGIIAAENNNQVGISGVGTNVRLYGYAKGNRIGNTVMENKYAFANLIGNRVKVINISMNFQSDLVFAASRGKIMAEAAVLYVTSNMEKFLNKLVIKGYDFIIVNSAGNDENKNFIADDSRYGYSEVKTLENAQRGNVLAENSNMFSWMTSPLLRDRIIVVGALDRDIYYSGEAKVINYRYAEFSNVGNRVDICAPGTEIVSTCLDSHSSNINILGYSSADGTSLAAPYISGLIGLMYQVNPGLNASRIKGILRENVSEIVQDRHGYSYSMPDAAKCVSAAITESGDSTDTILPNGFLLGKIVDGKGNGLQDVRIVACRTNVGESNLDNFCTTETSDSRGMYEFVLVEGVYDLNIVCDGYLPCVIRNVNINPDETLNMENIVLSTSFWGGFNSSLQGRVANAMNDSNIAGATVKIRKGWNNKEDAYATDKKGTEISALTDVDGNFKIKLPVGSYTIEVSKAGFVTGYFNAVSIGGNDSQGQKYVLTPVLSDSEYRIVLTWGDRPRDLDSHLTYYQNGIRKMHVFFGGRHGNVDGKSVAKLDYDDTSSYGSETITVTLNAEILDGGVFCYSVHDYTNAANNNTNALSLSDAVVRVYQGNQQIKTFSIPQNKYGTVWHVFDISEQGIKAVNEFKYVAGASGVE